MVNNLAVKVDDWLKPIVKIGARMILTFKYIKNHLLSAMVAHHMTAL